MLRSGDTDMGIDLGAYSSRQTLMTGHAAKEAAEDVKRQVLGETFKGAAVGTSPAYGCSALVAEVDVDLETGQVTIAKNVEAHDCGKAINLTSVEAQMQGAISMGIGEAMHEEVKFDTKGNVINTD